MTTPSTSIYVRPGSTSYTWNYANTSIASGAGAPAVVAVAFDTVGSAGQQVARGAFRYSVDGGRNWHGYTLATDREGAWMSASTLWRFVDKSGNDMVSPGSFTMRWKLADNTTVTANASLVVDNAPVGLVDDRDTMFASMQTGDTVATLAPIDTGSPIGGRWVIAGQSHPGLFAVAYDPAVDAPARIVIAHGAVLPRAGDAASISVHYYDRYQLDTNGAPIAGHGVGQTFSYYVVDGAAQQGPAFGAELALGASSGWETASPALATLGDGGFVTVWQGPESAGGGIWAQARDAAGAARGAPFAVAPAGGASDLGEPAVAALAGGRFVVAYSVNEGAAARIGYRIVEANGATGAQLLADAGGADASMPAVTALADGSFAIAWRSGGTVHARQVSAWGGLLGEERVINALGSAHSPSITALAGSDYAVAWGEINDGNVYAAIGSRPAFVVGGASVAASISTGAPLPHIAALSGGGFVVAWDSYRNEPRGFSSSDIFFQRFDSAGDRVGEVIQANEEGGGGRFDASIAARPDGGFVIAWQSDHGDYDGNGIFGRRFDANGVALDARDIEISQERAGDQATPGITALQGGGFAVAWVDTAANGDARIEARVMPGAGQQGGGATVDPTLAQPAALAGSEGANVFELTGGDQHVDGQGGLDTVAYHGSRAGFSVASKAGGFAVDDHAGANGHDALVNVERIRFSDGAVALDLDGVAGQAYRLYQAAFDRTPDLPGLGYWIAQMDRGLTLNEAAAAFSASKEFVDMYGANSTDAQFVDLLYQNVLHRPAEAGGFAYWMDALGAQHLAREAMLEFFSESAENQAQVIGSIKNGIDFVPWI
jgi:hypothetical protein